jgi:hypothetical protein
MEGRHWDPIMDQDLEYRTPSPNVHDIVKVFKHENRVYDEKNEEIAE